MRRARGLFPADGHLAGVETLVLTYRYIWLLAVYLELTFWYDACFSLHCHTSYHFNFSLTFNLHLGEAIQFL